MCGIAGWVDHEGLPPDAAHIVTAMNDRLTSRGPDGSGVWISPTAALAHRRLSVIDLDGGGQPMTTGADAAGADDLVLSYNGELYNFRELRRELSTRGHRFRSESDTEVVLAAWAEWGPAAVDRFTGIYAFAVWSPAARTLWLVRDRLGVKPLHYHCADGGMVFASEVKGLFAHPDVDPVVDDDGLRQLLVPLLKFPGANPYRNVAEVLPGEIVAYSPAGSSHHRYWDIAEVITRDHSAADPTDATATLAGLLQDTIAAQTVADVSVGTFLSGGLDSSVIAAFARRSPGLSSVRSFSVDFTDVGGTRDTRSALDRVHALAAATHIGSAHTNVVLDAHRLSDPRVRDATVEAHDQPTGCFGDLQMSMYLLCREIRGDVTVALSGEGADEILGGYRWFRENSAVVADTFPWIADGPAHGHLHQRARSVIEPGLVAALGLDDLVADEYRSALQRLDLPAGLTAAERRHREIIYLAVTYFLPMLLDRTDRLSMAHGLEVRVPFCDHRIVEHLVGLSAAHHNTGGREKGLLRDAARGMLPHSVLERAKSPFPSSPDPMYSAALSRQLANVVSDPPDGLAGIVRPELLRPGAVDGQERATGLVSNIEGEILLNMASWLRLYRPRLSL